MHKVKVTIGTDGKVEVKPEGVQGASCKDITAALEKALGNTIADAKTPDYYKTTSAQHKQTLGGS